ncbi:MAG: methionine biosynthesis protein MetW [Pseudomonadota bacterium]|nr:methionine biosynthesis protein MetW [Pseudomonadota bacterium]
MIGRPDFDAIASWIRSGSRVLDLGCGNGDLLKYLTDRRAANGYGVEICDENLLASVRSGANVIQMDLESGLSVFESHSFDYVILSQTLQAVHRTELIVREMLRVGKEGIVTFPNFGYWQHRLDVLRGRMPVSEDLPYQWYDTPNIHLCTLKDFETFCARLRVRIVERRVLTRGRSIQARANFFGSIAVYRLRAG